MAWAMTAGGAHRRACRRVIGCGRGGAGAPWPLACSGSMSMELFFFSWRHSFDGVHNRAVQSIQVRSNLRALGKRKGVRGGVYSGAGGDGGRGV